MRHNLLQEDDSVTDCIYDPDNDSVVIQQSWNLLYANEILQDVRPDILSIQYQGHRLFYFNFNAFILNVSPCVQKSMAVQRGYQIPWKLPLFQTQLGLSPEGQVGRFEDGRLGCSYSRYIIPALFSPDSPELNRVVNLTDPFHILMAKGPLFGIFIYPVSMKSIPIQ